MGGAVSVARPSTRSSFPARFSSLSAIATPGAILLICSTSHATMILNGMVALYPMESLTASAT